MSAPLDEILTRHRQGIPGKCEWCVCNWPCDASVLLSRLQEAEARNRQLAKERADTALRLGVERDNERVHRQRAEDLVAEFRKREETQDRIRDRLTAERDELRARLAAVEALCRSFDPTSGSGRARTFVNDLLVAAAVSSPADQPVTEHDWTRVKNDVGFVCRACGTQCHKDRPCVDHAPCPGSSSPADQPEEQPK